MNDGDCSVIEHLSGHVTVIDDSAAEKVGDPVQMSFASRSGNTGSRQVLWATSTGAATRIT